MKPADFLRDRAVYVALYVLFGVLTTTVVQLDLTLTQSSLTRSSLLYIFLLGLVGLAAYLLYDYNRQAAYWRRLTDLGPNEPLDRLGLLPVARSLEQRLYSQAWRDLYARLRAELTQEQERGRRNVRLVSQWAHHMKTPVAVIDLELQKGRKQNGAEAVLSSVAEENQRLSHSLHMLLNTIRLEEFEADFRVSQVDLGDLVRRLVNDHKREFIAHRVYPRVEIEPLVAVESDPKWLRFVLEQVLSNALKYASRPERDGQVLFRCRSVADETVLEVADNGIGILPEDVGRVFAPFFTGANGREYPQSTGMGLYLARETCRRLGHRILLESKQGEGTCVSLHFAAPRTVFAGVRATLTDR